MKANTIALAAAMLLGTAGCSQSQEPRWGPGNGPGPYGGPGMMYGAPGGYGPGGYGPGMMYGGRGGYGGGPGMYGGGPGMYGGGPGMMGGGRWGWLPDLSAEQRSQVAQAEGEFLRKQWPLMQRMHSLAWEGDGADDTAARRNYDEMAALQKQMFENHLELRKRIDALLTPAQRDALRRGRRG